MVLHRNIKGLAARLLRTKRVLSARTIFIVWVVFLAVYSRSIYANLPAKSGEASWTTEARRLTGEALYVRNASIQRLRSIKNIEGLLKSELGTENRFLALDAIAALNLHSLLPDVLALSKKDESGFFYRCINMLVTPSNQNTIANLYHERLSNPQTSCAAKVIILDTLFRMKVRLHPVELEKYLLSDPDVETRSAALYYLRMFLLYYRDTAYLDLLKKALTSNEASLDWRIQSLYVAKQLPQTMQKSLFGLQLNCSALDQEAVPLEIRALCKKLETPRVDSARLSEEHK